MTHKTNAAPVIRPRTSIFRQLLNAGSGGVPRLATQPPLAERHATWLELFFDLVFVFTIAELTHLTEGNLTFRGIGELLLLLLAVFWIWIGFAYYADQFDANDLPYRLLLMAGMFGVIILSLTIHDAFHGGAAAFALSYVILRSLVIALYIRAWLFVAEARPLVGRLLASYILSVILMAISIFVDEPACYYLWIIAMLVEYLGSPLAYITIRDVPAQISHMPERFGLFIIIVLGETVIAVGGSVQEFTWHTREVIGAVSSFVVVVSMWWLYFNRADSEVINRAVSSGRKRDLLFSYVYGYSHVLVALGAILGAASYIATIEAALHQEPIPHRVYVISSLSLAIYLLGTVLNHWATPHSIDPRQAWLRLGGGVLLVFLGVTRLITDPTLTVVAASVIILALAVMERPLDHHEHHSQEFELS